MCDCNWNAWYDRRKGSPTLHVSGTCECEMEGITIELAIGNQGTPPDPSMLVLRCTINRPATGPPVPTSVPVKWARSGGGRAKRVRISGDAHAVIPIKDVS